MRIAVLCPSPYSETSTAMAAHLSSIGYVPVGVLTLPAWDRRTLIRKAGQWGWRGAFQFAQAKLLPGRGKTVARLRNSSLEGYLSHGNGIFRSLSDVSRAYGFSVVTCRDQNSPRALAQMKEWAPDIAIFTGGNILRRQLLEIPRLGTLNSHLALLPEIRGMSTVEWSLLSDLPLGITIHFMDSGIDTGPLLIRREFRDFRQCTSIADLQNRMIAAGIGLIGDAVAGLHQGTISAVAQVQREEDHQYFVMHEALKALAGRQLKRIQGAARAGNSNA